jgi:hypothetical protein
LVGFDTAAARSVVVFKDDEDKILPLDKWKLLGASGYAPSLWLGFGHPSLRPASPLTHFCSNQMIW